MGGTFWDAATISAVAGVDTAVGISADVGSVVIGSIEQYARITATACVEDAFGIMAGDTLAITGTMAGSIAATAGSMAWAWRGTALSATCPRQG